MKEVSNTNQSGKSNTQQQGASAPAGNERSNDASRGGQGANKNGGQNGGQSGKSGEGRSQQNAGAEGKNGGADKNAGRSGDNNRGNGKSAAPSGSQAPKAGGHVRAEQIKPDMAVVCSEDGEFATVDHMEGKDTIKLKKDDDGKHHFIPLSWVTSVDDQVHIDRTGDEAMEQWRAEA